MHTIQLELQDEQYEYCKNSGIDIQSKFNEFLASVTDDGYPSISKEEAKRRVVEAVDDYRKNGLENYEEFDSNYWDNLEDKINNLKAV